MLPYGNGFMFNFVPIFIGIIFVIVIGTIIFRTINGIGQWSKNNNSPVLTVTAKIVTKRISVNNHHSDNNMNHSTSSTTYFVTFQVESGDRMEFKVNGNEYGMLVEGDFGRLTFQGSRYKGFERTIHYNSSTNIQND